MLTPVLLLLLIHHAERELRDYAEQRVAKAFDGAVDFTVLRAPRSRFPEVAA